MENFVTFELAKKLKEKGFSLNNEDVEFIGCRFIFSDECTIKRLSTIGAYENGYLGENIDCPTIQQALKWLREEKRIHIAIGYSGETRWRYVVIHLDDTYFFNPNITKKRFDKYEQAALAGIEYAIDNLI